MTEITIHHDLGSQTLVVWWGNPDDEVICEETECDVVVMKDARGHAIGMELIVFEPDALPLRVIFDQIDTSRGLGAPKHWRSAADD